MPRIQFNSAAARANGETVWWTAKLGAFGETMVQGEELLAERGGFEPPIQVLARITV
jgi:hypothetical protein